MITIPDFHQEPFEAIDGKTAQRPVREDQAAPDPDDYESRRQKLRDTCNTMNSSFYKLQNDELVLREHFMIDRKHKLVYCGIEKVGCTFWKRVLLSLGQSGEDHRNPFAIPGRLAHLQAPESFELLSFAEIYSILSSYTKFVFVREPYSRLFSGYVDKIFSPDKQYFWIRQHIAMLTRREKRNWECGTDITFAEFVKYVIHFLETGNAHLREEHFVQMYDHCRPCEIDYDIIGKMESFSADTGYILRSRGLGSYINLDIVEQETDADVITDFIDHFFQTKSKIEECIPFTKAAEGIWKTLQIRGLLEKTMLLPDHFKMNSSFSKADFKASVMQAYRDSDREKSRANRKDALAEAYRSISVEDINKFRRLFHADFEAFGYDIKFSDSFGGPNANMNFFFS